MKTLHFACKNYHHVQLCQNISKINTSNHYLHENLYLIQLLLALQVKKRENIYCSILINVIQVLLFYYKKEINLNCLITCLSVTTFLELVRILIQIAFSTIFLPNQNQWCFIDFHVPSGNLRMTCKEMKKKDPWEKPLGTL